VATAFQPNAFQDNAFQIDAGGASFGDGALSATGTGTATFVGASTADAPFSVTGTGTASFVGASTAEAPFSVTGTGTASFRAVTPAVLFANGGCDSDELLLNDGVSFVLLNDGTSLLQLNTGSPFFVGNALIGGALSATGTGTATFVGSSLADSTLAATGTATADFVGAFDGGGNNQDGALSVTATGAVPRNCRLLLNDGLSFILLNNGTDFLAKNEAACEVFVSSADDTKPFSMTGTWTATFVSASQGDAELAATGTGTAAFVGASDADTALSATGTATVSFAGAFDTAGYNCGLLLNDGSFVLLNDGLSVFLLNDATCLVPPSPATDAVLDAGGSGTASFVGAFDGAAVEPPVAGGGGVAAPGAWRVRKKKQKKKDELDDLIAQLKEQIVPYREAQEVGAQIMLRAELEHALTISLEGTLNEIESEIAALKEVLAEMDDEEALLLLM
jgi:hypothetical protein